MKTKRTFVAIELPADLRDRLSHSAFTMAGKWADGGLRPVASDNIHLTLRFLGDTDVEKVAAVIGGLDEIAAKQATFLVTTDQVGGFPNLRRPRVIWAGLTDPDAQLTTLNRQVERLVQSLGWERERGKRFSPHLTLARVRQRSRPPVDSWVTERPETPFRVEAICLIESVLKSGGAEYHPLHRALFSCLA